MFDPDGIIIVTMTGGRVNKACTGIVRHVITRQQWHVEIPFVTRAFGPMPGMRAG